ncbi:hypothetical protein [Nocardiopsis sp. CNT312]|uniref:hypothetical protein n=1 Tax=Nocardiopsis sp. CNT312 TaxID=1137268 RepID=UPI0004BB8172|nr:hypothetical protein [Nocardiopsis sp. CNT312]
MHVPQSSRFPWRAATAAALLTLTACSTPTGPEATDEPDASSTATVDPVQAEAALEAYRSAHDIYIDMLQGQRSPDDAQVELEQLSSGQALESFTNDARNFAEAGVTFEGDPTSDPEVTGLDLDADPPVATITDCWDDTSWQPVNGDGQPLEHVDGPSRRVINARAERHDDGWVLTLMSPEEGRTC